MATSAGVVRIKVVPDLDGFSDAVIDAIAEKVAVKIAQNDMLIRAQVRESMRGVTHIIDMDASEAE